MTTRQLAPATSADIARELGVAPHWVRRHAEELQGWKDHERGGPDGAWLFDWGPAISAGRRALSRATGRRRTYWWRHEYVECPRCGERDLLAKVKVTDLPYPKHESSRISVTTQLHLLCPTAEERADG